MEILIVICLVSILAVGLIVYINPKNMIDRAWDQKRKQDISGFQKIAENIMDDKDRYPLPTEICYDRTNNYSCPICGKRATSPKKSTYFDSLPCDPASNYDYVYQVDDLTNPQWYRVYTRLTIDSDNAVSKVGCNRYSCGYAEIPPAPHKFVYNYYVESSAPKACPNLNRIFCWKNGCNVCLDAVTCQSQLYCDLEKGFYSDSNCMRMCSMP